MHLFYSEDLSKDLIQLTAEESRHCAKALRIQPGDEVAFVDGKGQFCKARMLSVDARASQASVVHREKQKPRSFHLHIAIAPTKNIYRFEWFLEKATECGIDEITPILCEQSERRVIKPARLNKILIAAMKQSQRAYLPQLNEAVKLSQLLENYQSETPAFIAHCDKGQKHPLGRTYQPGSDALVLIGPEGDFSNQEVQTALEKGMKPVSLGENRLRTETAAMVTCIQLNSINNLL